MSVEQIKNLLILFILTVVASFIGFLIYILVKFVARYRKNGSKWMQILYKKGIGEDCKNNKDCASNLCKQNLCIV